MSNGYGVLGYGVLDTFLLGPLSTFDTNIHVQANEPLQYSPKPRRAGHDTGSTSSYFFLDQLR